MEFALFNLGHVPRHLSEGHPGAEHERLAKSVGTWDVDATMWMAPDAPPSMVGVPRKIHSPNVQAQTAAAVARNVLMNTWAANALAPFWPIRMFSGRTAIRTLSPSSSA